MILIKFHKCSQFLIIELEQNQEVKKSYCFVLGNNFRIKPIYFFSLFFSSFSFLLPPLAGHREEEEEEKEKRKKEKSRNIIKNLKNSTTQKNLRVVPNAFLFFSIPEIEILYIYRTSSNTQFGARLKTKKNLFLSKNCSQEPNGYQTCHKLPNNL